MTVPLKQPEGREWQKQMDYLAAINSEALQGAAPSAGDDMTCFGMCFGEESQKAVSAHWSSVQLPPFGFSLQWTGAYTLIFHDGENRQTSQRKTKITKTVTEINGSSVCYIPET